MAMTATTRTAPFGAITAYRLINLIDRTYTAFRQWIVAQETDRELRSLSDRQLEDIGLSRGMIEDFASRAALRG